MSDPIPQRFHNSLQRCLLGNDFLESFYQRFLATSDEVAEAFHNTDFTRQRELLQKSLHTVIMMRMHHDVPEYRREMKRIAIRHDRHHLNIRPENYEIWARCLLDTVEAYDPAWNEEVRDAWQDVLAEGIVFMIQHY